ncbi:hypothetical protein M0802_005031 [Mischocyttarus mexicanus]|nr:hypothetical protein M0802_005031 [Mischocyttarus mexicanus]
MVWRVEEEKGTSYIDDERGKLEFPSASSQTPQQRKRIREKLIAEIVPNTHVILYTGIGRGRGGEGGGGGRETSRRSSFIFQGICGKMQMRGASGNNGRGLGPYFKGCFFGRGRWWWWWWQWVVVVVVVVVVIVVVVVVVSSSNSSSGRCSSGGSDGGGGSGSGQG